MPEIGMQAPEFKLPGDGEKTITLSALGPRRVVLFFYPRDDTSGCTREAQEFSELMAEFEAADVVVLGISKDTVQSHEKFRAKRAISVPLLSDADGNTCEDYGVWVKKSMYGKSYLGIERTTFLIDARGVITHIWPKVKVPGHAQEVLTTVRGG